MKFGKNLEILICVANLAQKTYIFDHSEHAKNEIW